MIKSNFIKELIGRYLPYILQILGRVLPRALSMVLSILIVRFAGKALLGDFGALNSLLSMTIGVLAAGNFTDFLRSGEENQFSDSVEVMTLGASILYLPLLLIAFYGLDFDFISFTLFYLVFLATGYAKLYGVLGRFLKQDILSIIPVSFPLLAAIIGVVIFRPDNLVDLSYVYAFAWAVTVTYLGWNNNLFVKFKPFSKRVAKKIIIISGLIGTVLATQVYGSTDQLMLKKMISPESAGTYRMGVAVTSVAYPVIGVFAFFFLSKAKGIVERMEAKRFKEAFTKQVMLNLFIGAVFVGASYLFIGEALEILYGVEGKGSENVAIILSLAVLLNILNTVWSYGLLAFGKDNIVFYGVCFSAALNVVFNYIFIKLYAESGAAWVSVATQVILFLYLFGFLILFWKRFENESNKLTVSHER